MKDFIAIACILCLWSCSSNGTNHQSSEAEQVEVVEMPYNSYVYGDTTSYIETEVAPSATVSTTAPSNISSTPRTTRSEAFQNAFNLGRQLGAQDAQNGENNCRAYAEVYSDDWIQQQFIQGYESAYNEVMAARSYEPGYDDDDDNYYYYEEDDY